MSVGNCAICSCIIYLHTQIEIYYKNIRKKSVQTNPFIHSGSFPESFTCIWGNGFQNIPPELQGQTLLWFKELLYSLGSGRIVWNLIRLVESDLMWLESSACRQKSGRLGHEVWVGDHEVDSSQLVTSPFADFPWPWSPFRTFYICCETKINENKGYFLVSMIYQRQYWNLSALHICCEDVFILLRI